MSSLSLPLLVLFMATIVLVLYLLLLFICIWTNLIEVAFFQIFNLPNFREISINYPALIVQKDILAFNKVYLHISFLLYWSSLCTIFRLFWFWINTGLLLWNMLLTLTVIIIGILQKDYVNISVWVCGVDVVLLSVVHAIFTFHEIPLLAFFVFCSALQSPWLPKSL